MLHTSPCRAATSTWTSSAWCRTATGATSCGTPSASPCSTWAKGCAGDGLGGAGEVQGACVLPGATHLRCWWLHRSCVRSARALRASLPASTLPCCPQFQPSEQLDVASLPFASKWILSKLNGAVSVFAGTVTATCSAAACWRCLSAATGGGCTLRTQYRSPGALYQSAGGHHREGHGGVRVLHCHLGAWAILDTGIGFCVGAGRRSVGVGLLRCCYFQPRLGVSALWCPCTARPSEHPRAPLCPPTAHPSVHPRPTSTHPRPVIHPHPLTHQTAPSAFLQAAYSFWQYELCDVYIELVKPVMYQDDAGVLWALRGFI